jgi:hypothetical protein
MTKHSEEDDLRAALVGHALQGVTATTAARGIAVGDGESRLVERVGVPTRATRDQDMGDGRFLTELLWTRSILLAGRTIEESLMVSWATRPVDRGVTGIGLILRGTAADARAFRDAFGDVKLRLREMFKPGENKSSFRAPGFGAEGFVATFLTSAKAPIPTLTINAGLIE